MPWLEQQAREQSPVAVAAAAMSLACQLLLQAVRERQVSVVLPLVISLDPMDWGLDKMGQAPKELH